MNCFWNATKHYLSLDTWTIDAGTQIGLYLSSLLKDLLTLWINSDRSQRRSHGKSLDVDANKFLVNESVSIISPGFASALKMLAKEALEEIPHPTFEIEEEFSSPYLWCESLLSF